MPGVEGPHSRDSHQGFFGVELATPSVPEGVLVEIKGLKESPTHNPAIECELQLVAGLYIEELMDMDLVDWIGEVIPSVPESPASPLVPPS